MKSIRRFFLDFLLKKIKHEKYLMSLEKQVRKMVEEERKFGRQVC